MKNFTTFIKLTFITLCISLIGFILPLTIANGTSSEIMQILFAIEICVAVFVTLVYFAVKERKNKESVKERNRSFKHNERIQKSVDYYEVIASEKANQIADLFSVA